MINYCVIVIFDKQNIVVLQFTIMNSRKTMPDFIKKYVIKLNELYIT